MKTGWDRASETHHVTVIDGGGVIVDSFEAEHTEERISAALTRLRRHGEPAEVYSPRFIGALQRIIEFSVSHRLNANDAN